MAELGKLLVVAGVLLVCVGGLFLFGGKVPWLGRLPGDIVVQRDNFSFYFPIATCLVISVVLSFVFALLRR